MHMHEAMHLTGGRMEQDNNDSYSLTTTDLLRAHVPF